MTVKTRIEKRSEFNDWFDSEYAKQYLGSEQAYLKNALRQVSGPRVLQLGNVIDSKMIEEVDFPQLIVADIDRSEREASLLADPAFLPIEHNLMSTIIVPHVLERHKLPHQVLREVHRVLMPEGHIILTGFNPISCLGLQRFLYRTAVCPGNYITVKRVSDWLQLLGFEIIGSANFQYSPLVNSLRLRKCFNFLNSVGDRWLPLLGGGYIITARKKQMASTLIGESPLLRKVSVKKRNRKLISASSNKKETINQNYK